ncbi:tyrosine-type recombinase/integrase [Mesorhizobium sp. M0522]|uniref:tyrosine-type recombinase/integrase n=1 Tax=Mesorhizobium sp. M0522 TaxID=2956958 RepID=UPI00333C9452
MADSTRAMRRAIFDRDILPAWQNRLLKEITPDDLRALCAKVKERGAPATAIHARDIAKQIFGFAILNGEKVANPADDVGPASMATFAPKDRALSPVEIRIMLKQLEHVPTLPTIRLGLRLLLLTMVRKSELQDAVWDEVDFENALWSIPKERMKRSRPHNVYLSQQALDIMIALKTCAGNSRYLRRAMTPMRRCPALPSIASRQQSSCAPARKVFRSSRSLFMTCVAQAPHS